MSLLLLLSTQPVTFTATPGTTEARPGNLVPGYGAVTITTTTVTATRGTSWAISGLIPVTATHATTWTTIARVTPTHATTWTVRTPVGNSRATTWAARTRTTDTRATTWQILAPVGATRDTSWFTDSNIQVASRPFLLLGLTGHTLTVVTPTITTVGSTRDTTWGVSAAAVPGHATVLSSTSGTTTAPLPPDAQTGDMILAYAYSSTATTPTLPTGWSNVTNNAASPAFRLQYRVYDGAWTMPTFTNAAQVHAILIRGQAATTPAGSLGTLNATSATITWPASDTPSDLSGAAVFIRAAVHSNPGVVIPTPDGYTRLQGAGTSPGFITIVKDDTTTLGGATATVTNSAAYSRNTVEVKAAPVVTTVTDTRGTSWGTNAPAETTHGTTWVTGATVTAGRDTTWTARTPVTAIRGTTWAATTRVSSTHATTWTTRTTAAINRATTWATATRTTSTHATTWATSATTATDRATTWATGQQVNDTRGSTWTIAATAGIRTATGSFATYVTTFYTNEVSATGSGLYTIPTTDEETTLGLAWSDLMDGAYTSAAARADTLNFEVVQFTDTDNGRVYYMLRERTVTRYWGLYVWNPTAAAPVAYYAPHPRFDAATHDEARKLFQQDNARQYFLAGAHRNAVTTTDADGDTWSDVSNADHSVFKELSDRSATRPEMDTAVQVHGYANATYAAADIVLSSGTSTYGQDYLASLRDRIQTATGLTVHVYDGTLGGALGATGSATLPAWRTAAKRIVHMEQNSTVRTTTTTQDAVVAAVVAWTGNVQVGSTRGTAWATNGTAPATRLTTWVTSQQTTTTRASTWNVAGTIATVTATRSSTWAARAPVSAAHATTWTATARVTGTRSTTWAARATLATNRTTTWAATTTVTGTRSSTWATAQPVTSTRGTNWAVAGALFTVTATRGTTWNVAGALVTVTASRGTTWTTRAFTTTTHGSSWTVRTPVAPATRGSSWGVLTPTSTTRLSTWTTRAPVTTARASTWTTRARLATTKPATWDTLTRLTTAHAATWLVGTTVTSTRSTLWAQLEVEGPIGRIVSVRWRVLAASGDLSTPDAVGDLTILEAIGATR